MTAISAWKRLGRWSWAALLRWSSPEVKICVGSRSLHQSPSSVQHGTGLGLPELPNNTRAWARAAEGPRESSRTRTGRAQGEWKPINRWNADMSGADAAGQTGWGPLVVRLTLGRNRVDSRCWSTPGDRISRPYAAGLSDHNRQIRHQSDRPERSDQWPPVWGGTGFSGRSGDALDKDLTLCALKSRRHDSKTGAAPDAGTFVDARSVCC